MSGDTLLSIVQDDVSDDYRRRGAAAELARREKYKAAEQSVRDNEDDKMDIDKDIMDENRSRQERQQCEQGHHGQARARQEQRQCGRASINFLGAGIAAS